MDSVRLHSDSLKTNDGPTLSIWLMIWRSAFLWGTLATCLFYWSIPLFSADEAFFQRYFCAHWILYATTWLFGIGLAILVGKSLGLPNDNAVFAYRFARNPQLLATPDWQQRLEMLSADVQHVSPKKRNTVLFQRYRDVLDYLNARGNSDTLEDHLKYLHDVAGEKLHDSYAPLRTIIWAIPILGFLGTVIGITMAIANITPDQLEKSMSSVTAGLAVAFDTTALSLTLSMILVFLSFLTERSEQMILSRVEALGLRDIIPALTATSLSRSPLERAENAAANQLLRHSEQVVTWQMELWKSSLDAMRNRWESIMQQQQVSFANALHEGMRATLSSHHQELAQTRQELVQGLHQVTDKLAALISSSQENTLAQQSAMGEKLATLWGSVQSELQALRSEQSEQVEFLTKSFSNEILQWQSQLQEATRSTVGQVKELQSQGQTLLKIVSEEVDLNRLQKSLSTNLEALNAADTFEKALHSLTAAVHMMTIRNRAA